MALGIWDVDRWLETITWEQFLQWERYAQVEPFGEERADLRAGIVASVIANVNRDPQKGEPYKPTDFMLDFTGKRKPAETSGPMGKSGWQRLKSMAKQMAGMKAEG